MSNIKINETRMATIQGIYHKIHKVHIYKKIMNALCICI